MVLFLHIHFLFYYCCWCFYFHFSTAALSFYFPLFLQSILSPPPLWSSIVQCGFFKRTEPRRHYETEYYRAHLGVQPSEVEKQASEL